MFWRYIMALSYSVDRTDYTGRELLTYGTEDFPIAFFDDDLTKVSVPWHWHDEFEIVVVLEGTVQVRIANSVLTLNAGDGYFTNSGILHSAVLQSATGHQHAMVFSPNMLAQNGDLIWKTYVEPLLCKLSLPFVKLSASDPIHHQILTLAEEAWISGSKELTDYPITVRHNLTRVLSLLASQIGTLEHETLFTAKDQKDELRIKQILQYIETNYPSAVTIDQIAASADISISSCLRLFKNVLNTTPIRYLIDYRLQKAAEELEHQNGRTISEIAYSCGISDAVYFNRCFKKRYHCTPTEYVSRGQVP